MSDRAIIRMERLEKTYQLGDVQVQALRGVHLEIEAGSYVAIMGPSGSGKSTLLNLLGCLDHPTAGSYYLGGENVASMNDEQLSIIRGKRLGLPGCRWRISQRSAPNGKKAREPRSRASTCSRDPVGSEIALDVQCGLEGVDRLLRRRR